MNEIVTKLLMLTACVLELKCLKFHFLSAVLCMSMHDSSANVSFFSFNFMAIMLGTCT